jgi:hypothetical protein
LEWLDIALPTCRSTVHSAFATRAIAKDPLALKIEQINTMLNRFGDPER